MSLELTLVGSTDNFTQTRIATGFEFLTEFSGHTPRSAWITENNCSDADRTCTSSDELKRVMT
jgi:hypothetical protein